MNDNVKEFNGLANQFGQDVYHDDELKRVVEMNGGKLKAPEYVYKGIKTQMPEHSWKDIYDTAKTKTKTKTGTV